MGPTFSPESSWNGASSGSPVSARGQRSNASLAVVAMVLGCFRPSVCRVCPSRGCTTLMQRNPKVYGIAHQSNRRRLQPRAQQAVATSVPRFRTSSFVAGRVACGTLAIDRHGAAMEAGSTGKGPLLGNEDASLRRQVWVDSGSCRSRLPCQRPAVRVGQPNS